MRRVQTLLGGESEQLVSALAHRLTFTLTLMICSAQRPLQSLANDTRPVEHSCRRSGRKRLRVELRLSRTSATGNPVQLLEKDVEFLTTLGEQVSSAKSITPKQSATASLIAATQGLTVEQGPQERLSPTVEVRLRSGRIQSGELCDTDVLLKIYPPASGSNTDLLVRNEIAVHTNLQQLFLGTQVPGSERVAHLLGFLTCTTGEQVLVFRKDAEKTAEEYCSEAAETSHQLADGNGGALQRRKAFVKATMVQVLEGLAFMHRRERIHQKLEPRNVLLSTTREASPELLLVQLQDLALAVDVSDAALLGGATLAELWRGQKERDDPLKALADPIWERAKQAGAASAREQQIYAVSEDILSAGLLVAYLAFVPFCPPGSIDFAAIQRLLGVTFQAEMGAAREYCEADERWHQAVAFLNEDIGSGWDLIQSMIFPDYKLRPTAELCLSHPFLKGR